MFKYKFILEDISMMARVIVLPHITLSTIFTYILHELNPAKLPFELHEIFVFSLTSFPLTIAAVIIVYNVARGKGSIVFFAGIIVLMSIISSVLHSWISQTPDIEPFLINNNEDAKKYGVFYNLVMAFRLVVYYFKLFGWVVFVQAIIVGSIAGNSIAKMVLKRQEK